MKPYFIQFSFYYEHELDKKGRIYRKVINSMSLAAIILCAGNGTRMNSDLPKVLHKLAGFPLIHHVMNTAQELGVSKTVIVVGKDSDKVSKAAFDFNDDVIIEKQDKQLGTGHAVQKAMPALKNSDDDVIILYGDVPFITPTTIKKMLTVKKEGSDLVVLGFESSQPGAYGRIVTKGDKIEKIVEAKDASDAELQIKSCNSGVILTNSKNLMQLVKLLNNNNTSKEYYLTDIIDMAVADGLPVNGFMASTWEESMGINDKIELARAERLFQKKLAKELMQKGVTIMDPARIDIRGDIKCGRDVLIDVNTVFEGKVHLGNNVKIGPNTYICDAKIGDNSVIHANSHILGAEIGANAQIGPFARLRPGVELQNNLSLIHISEPTRPY